MTVDILWIHQWVSHLCVIDLPTHGVVDGFGRIQWQWLQSYLYKCAAYVLYILCTHV